MSSLYILGINSLDKSLVNIFDHSMAQIVKNLPAMWEIWSISGSGRPGFDPWRREWLPPEYSCLENPMDRGACGLQPMRSQRVGHNWVTNTFTFTFTFTAHMFGGQLLSRTLLRETVLSFPQKFQGYFLESCINGPRCLDCHKINWMNFTLEQYPYSIRMY